MIISIFGPTCGGKTTVANELARRLGRPLRSCGDLVRARAFGLGISLADFSDTEHRDLDGETARWARGNDRGIVEGRFLDAVLYGIPNALFVMLTADDDVRVARGNKRRHGFSTEDLRASDGGDDVFRGRMYGAASSTGWHKVIDTTHMTVEECAARIEEWVLRAEAHLD